MPMPWRRDLRRGVRCVLPGRADGAHAGAPTTGPPSRPIDQIDSTVHLLDGGPCGYVTTGRASSGFGTVVWPWGVGVRVLPRCAGLPGTRKDRGTHRTERAGD